MSQNKTVLLTEALGDFAEVTPQDRWSGVLDRRWTAINTNDDAASRHAYTVDDTEAPTTVPPPDDTDDAFVSPFTGAPGTGFGGAPLIPAPVPVQPKFTECSSQT